MLRLGGSTDSLPLALALPLVGEVKVGIAVPERIGTAVKVCAPVRGREVVAVGWTSACTQDAWAPESVNEHAAWMTSDTDAPPGPSPWMTAASDM